MLITCCRGSPKKLLDLSNFQVLRIGREQHVPDSSNHSLSLVKPVELQLFWGTRWREPLARWFGLSFAPKPKYNERFARQYRYSTRVSPDFALLRHSSPSFGSWFLCSSEHCQDHWRLQVHTSKHSLSLCLLQTQPETRTHTTHTQHTKHNITHNMRRQTQRERDREREEIERDAALLKLASPSSGCWHVCRTRSQDHGIYIYIYIFMSVSCFAHFSRKNVVWNTRTFHDVYCSKPLTFHNGWIFHSADMTNHGKTLIQRKIIQPGSKSATV